MLEKIDNEKGKARFIHNAVSMNFNCSVISEKFSLTLGHDGRVVVSDIENKSEFHVCPSYGLHVHIHNDTLASLLCQKLKKGNIGIAQVMPLEQNRELLQWIQITDTENYATDYGSVVNDSCSGLEKSLAISCTGKTRA